MRLNVDLSGHILITHKICITAQRLLTARMLVSTQITIPDGQTREQFTESFKHPTVASRAQPATVQKASLAANIQQISKQYESTIHTTRHLAS